MAKMVVVSGVRAPSATHVARGLACAQATVIGVDMLRFPVGRFSSSVARYRQVSSPVHAWERFAHDINGMISHYAPSLWVPTCEEVFHLARLAQHHTALKRVLFAPDFSTLVRAHDKHQFAQDARLIDHANVETHLLTRASDIAHINPSTHVFKPVFSRFAEQVLVCPSKDKLQHIEPTPECPWVAQTYLPGEELCTYTIAQHGKVVSTCVYRGKHRAGQGASIWFERVHDDEIVKFVEKYVEHTKWHGQLGFDFRFNDEHRPVAIECNPRTTSGVHLWKPDHCLGEVLLGRALAPNASTHPQMVASAMMTFGFQQAWRQGDIVGWMKDMWRAHDVLRGAWGCTLGQVVSLAELMLISRQENMSLLKASTQDMAWNHA